MRRFPAAVVPTALPLPLTLNCNRNPQPQHLMHNLLSPAARPATHTEDVEEVTVYLPRKLVLAWRSAVASENAALQRPPLTPEEWQRKLNAYCSTPCAA